MHPNAPAVPRSVPGDAFSFEKSVHGDVTILTLKGTLNDAFDGRKVADAVKTKKAIVVMRGVRRFASWGMTEWLEFLRLRRDRDIYLVACSTYAVSQSISSPLLGREVRALRVSAAALLVELGRSLIPPTARSS